MVENAFCFTTGMMHKSGKCIWNIVYVMDTYHRTKEFDKATASSSKSTSTPKGMNKNKIYAPASPAYSSKVSALPYAARRTSLRPSDTGMDVE